MSELLQLSLTELTKFTALLLSPIFVLLALWEALRIKDRRIVRSLEMLGGPPNLTPWHQA